MPEPPVLPEWYARVDPDQLPAISVFGPTYDCETALFGPERRSLALFAGFLFDRQELARDLGLEVARANVDVLVAAWERWQVGLLDHLDGNYLMAVWDADEQCLTLGRDAMGFFPLYYSVFRQQLWFGPNVLSLAHSGRIPKAPDRRSLALGLITGAPSHGETFFEGIQRLPPGQGLRWQHRQNLQLVSCWDPLPADAESWLPDEQVVEEFEPRLQQAVNRCLQQGPRGVTFSGGLDSTAILALANASTSLGSKPSLTAYSAVAPSGFASDDGEPWQLPVTKALGLAHHVSDARQWLGDRSLMAANLEEIPLLPCPTSVWWVGAFLGFFRSIAGQAGRIVLTGNGGDDWLGVPEWWSADLLRAARLGTAIRFLRSYLGSGGRSWRYAGRELLWRFGLRTLITAQGARLAPGHWNRRTRRNLERSIPTWLCLFGDDRLALIESLYSRRALLLTPSGQTPKSFLRQLNRHAFDNPFSAFERERNFHEERLVGLRCLHPFLDRQWIEFVSRASPESLLYNGQYKGLLRPILEKHLPGVGVESQRKGYARMDQDFLTRSFNASLPAALESIRFNALADLSLVRAEYLSEAVRPETTSHEQRARQFTLLSAEIWLESHF